VAVAARMRGRATGADDVSEASERGSEDRAFELRVFKAGRFVGVLVLVVSIVFGAAAGDDGGDGVAIAGVAVVIAAAAAGVGVLPTPISSRSPTG
jgi:hypothetical protein